MAAAHRPALRICLVSALLFLLLLGAPPFCVAGDSSFWEEAAGGTVKKRSSKAAPVISAAAGPGRRRSKQAGGTQSADKPAPVGGAITADKQGAAYDFGGGMSFHTIFSAECSPYFDWQSLGLVRSHREAGMKGPITRLLACNDEDLKKYKVGCAHLVGAPASVTRPRCFPSFPPGHHAKLLPRGSRVAMDVD